MIDGVNVAGCVRLQDDEISCDLGGECKGWENCYFKQLQKEKFENLNNRQMVESAENLIYENSELIKNLEEKKQECEELLKENQQLRNSLSDSLMFKFTGQENETNRYRKALDDIQKIALRYVEAQGRYDILDIINKAKGEIMEIT